MRTELIAFTIRPAIATLLLMSVLTVNASELSEQERRGKQLYTQGVSESGAPVTAVLSRGATPIPGSILPCVGCHGEDGKGRAEGGVVPSNITWSALRSSQGHNHSYGRSHPAFDEQSLGLAITEGVDPGDNPLGVAMPRFQMSEADIADLVAYIKTIETDLDPGLFADKIRIGTLLPSAGPAGSYGQVMYQVIESYFEDINQRGGIHGRKIEIVSGGYEQDPSNALWEARDFLEQDPVFAMVSGYLSGVEEPITALADELQLPLIGPYTPLPQTGDGLQRYTFYLTGGIVQQATILATSRSEQTKEPLPLAIVYPRGSVYDDVIGSVQLAMGVEQAPAFKLAYPLGYFDATDFAEILRREGAGRVLFLGSAVDMKRLATEAATLDWHPDLLLPGVYASGGLFEIPVSFEGRVFVGYSTLPLDHTPRGVEQFEKLHEDYRIDYRHSTQQIAAYVAAMVLAEGIKRSGRELSREKLVMELEHLSDFQPGLMPTLSYAPSRRIGALGGYVVELDLKEKKFGTASKWIQL
jgi:ABC-type branched-subunit amino acid transport system substrate-binding protein